MITKERFINKHILFNFMSYDKSLDGIIQVAGPHVTDAMLATLKNYYKSLRVEKGERTTLDLREMSPEDQERVHLDVAFYLQNPHLPLENLCSRLDNYHPKNDSQRQLLDYAGKLVTFSDLSKPAGIWAHGEAGVGKSHISAALAKEFMKKSYKPIFVQFGGNSIRTNMHSLAPQQVWIIDDLNSPYSFDRDLFMQVSLNGHNTGGRLFVTSNMDYEMFMDKLVRSIGDVEGKRYTDRIKGMFKVLSVVGESNRQQTVWYAK